MSRIIILLSLFVLISCSDSIPASAPENLTPAEFTEKMAEEDVVILDVRTPEEVAAGKIEGAREIDYRDPAFAEKIAELDRNKTYLVYCAVGGRSSSTCEMMAESGFERVYNLEGGYTAWSER